MAGFFLWHYTEGSKNFFRVWKNYLEFFWYRYSIGRFLKTLFSPWKRDVSRVGERGFHPVLLLQTLILNIITRIIGSLVRSAVIIAGLIMEILAIILGALLLIIWLLAPLVFVFSLGEIVFSLTKDSQILVLFWSVALFLSLAITAISLLSFRNKDRDYLSENLANLAKEKWFERVWNRIGKTGSEISPGILENEEALQEYLRTVDVTPQEFLQIVGWETLIQIEREKKRKFWLKENLMSGMPIGRNWTYAYTVHLDNYSADLSLADFSEYSDAELVGMENDLSELEQILLRSSQNNAILIGEAGVGKDTIIHTLAKRIRTNDIRGGLGNKRILEIDIKQIIADHSADGGLDQILSMLFSEASYAGNIILVMKDMHEYVGDPSGSGHDISSILSEFLGVSSFQIIGLTDPAQFHSKIEKKSNIMKYCEKIMIDEMSGEDAMKVMSYKLRDIEKNRVIFTYQALREIVKLSDRYISDSPYPEKALDLMEEVILHWKNLPSDQFITARVVDSAVSAKIKVPLGEVGSDESEKLLNLEKYLHERVVGQEFAVQQIAETMRRARIGMTDSNKPIGSFLFMGPTGVGKTESSKALAEAYFGDENRMIRLDMSEYQTQESIDRLIGSAATGKEGYLVSKVKENPYALLLLDEVEKAYPDILNLFLQVLDEGHLTDAFGKKISFRNLIIIATSNAGSEIIKEGIRDNLPAKAIQKQVIDWATKEGVFRPEFLNRFEGVVFFTPLSQEDIFKVTGYLLEKYQEKLRQEENIDVTFEQGLVEKVAQNAYDPTFGARAIHRYIEDKIGDKIVKKIISGELQKGVNFSFEVGDMEE